MLKLGGMARDRITGFKGVVTARCQRIYGSDRAEVTPLVGDDGAHKEGVWFDEASLDVDTFVIDVKDPAPHDVAPAATVDETT